MSYISGSCSAFEMCIITVHATANRFAAADDGANNLQICASRRRRLCQRPSPPSASAHKFTVCACVWVHSLMYNVHAFARACVNAHQQRARTHLQQWRKKNYYVHRRQTGKHRPEPTRPASPTRLGHITIMCRQLNGWLCPNFGAIDTRSASSSASSSSGATAPPTTSRIGPVRPEHEHDLHMRFLECLCV